MQHLWTLMGLLLFQSLTAEETSSSEPVYKAVGEQVVLTPDSVDVPIVSIMWKHGSDLAVLWDRGETVSYRQFQVHSVLNSSTGALTITGLSRSDSGSYEVEINDRVTNRIQLRVISRVSKPSVSTYCDPEMTYCVFTCEGNTTDAEPVTYRWRANDMTWPSTNVHNISNDEKEPWFKCMLENPVSFSASDSVVNPFASDQSWISISLIVLAALILVACVLAIVIIIVIRRRNVGWMVQEISTLSNGHGTPDLTCVVSHDNNNVTELQDKLIQDSTFPNAGIETENNAAEQPAEEPQDEDQI